MFFREIFIRALKQANGLVLSRPQQTFTVKSAPMPGAQQEPGSGGLRLPEPALIGRMVGLVPVETGRRPGVDEPPPRPFSMVYLVILILIVAASYSASPPELRYRNAEAGVFYDFSLRRELPAAKSNKT